ncbi:hypothetical protein ACB092_02G162300 [Castanea dentata]
MFSKPATYSQSFFLFQIYSQNQTLKFFQTPATSRLSLSNLIPKKLDGLLLSPLSLSLSLSPKLPSNHNCLFHSPPSPHLRCGFSQPLPSITDPKRSAFVKRIYFLQHQSCKKVHICV